MSTLTAQQAADRLGVKLTTLYAYVSRGVLQRAQGSQLHASVFDEDEVERLARRGRPRRAGRPFVFEVEIETRLTEARDGVVRFRGHEAAALATSTTFEEVATLMWTGALPSAAPTWTSHTSIDPPPGADLADRLRSAVVQAGAADPLRADLRPEAVAACGASLVATLVDALAPVGRAAPARLVLGEGRRTVRGSIAARLWSRLTAQRATPESVALLNAALVLLVDHELASSTFAARIAASTRADPYAVVLAGLGVVSGPLHGGASRAAWAMYDAAGRTGTGPALSAVLRDLGRYPGFGHVLHTRGDPRAAALLALVRSRFAGRRELAIVDDVLAAVQRRSAIQPNVDAALAALAYATGMPAGAGEAIFTVARAAGWLAHAIEEYEQPPLRFRPRARFVGA